MASYAPHFISWVSEVAKADFKEFEKVKPVCIAQSIRETGRGNTAISKDHNNLLGVKYHDFLYLKRSNYLQTICLLIQRTVR